MNYDKFIRRTINYSQCTGINEEENFKILFSLSKVIYQEIVLFGQLQSFQVFYDKSIDKSVKLIIVCGIIYFGDLVRDYFLIL
jgi:hypothetical protein